MNKKILIVVIIIGIILIIGLVFTMNFRELTNKNTHSGSNNNQKALEENPSFFGNVVETNPNYIIVEPDENEEERKSSDKISISLGEYNDAIYPIGTRVKITYTGEIMESYPAQVNAVKIEIK